MKLELSRTLTLIAIFSHVVFLACAITVNTTSRKLFKILR